MTIQSTQISNYGFGNDYNYQNDRRSLDSDLKNLFQGLQRFQKNIKYGNGTPEGNIIAQVGSVYLRFDGGTGTTLYIKETGISSTGWVPVTSGGGGGSSPGGSNGDIQYNNAGAFGGFGDWNGSILTVGGDLKIGSANAIYIGDEATNGSWRIIRSGNNLAFERREGGSWIEKSAVTP